MSLPPGQHRKDYMTRAGLDRPGKVKSLAPVSLQRRRYHSLETVKGLEDALDVVTSRIVRRRDPFCVTCGESRPELLTCSHFYRRGHMAIRFDLRNCNTQCAECNQLHNTNTIPYNDYFLERYGLPVMAELYELKKVIKFWTVEGLRALLAARRCMLKGMG